MDRGRLRARLTRGLLAGMCLLPAWPAVSARAAAPVASFRGLGTWVDLFDTRLRADPEAAVARMHADGVRTLYLETSNFSASAAIVSPDIVSRFIVAAHADGMRVVAWYLPSFARPGIDRFRARAAVAFRTSGGQRFDAFALDIESSQVTHVGLRTSRLLDLAAALRASAGPRYPLGAIVPAPEGMRLNPAYWPGFPFRGLRADFNVFLPMDYFTYHVTTAAAAHDYTTANVALLRRDTRDPAVPIHLIGGIADTASVAEVTAFVHAARERGVLGASLYDDATTRPAEWAELAGVPVNPRQAQPMPLRLPSAPAYGNIPGGDRSHPKEVFYAGPRAGGTWAVRYQGFDLGPDEVQLWVNWQHVRTLGPATAGGWSPVRSVVIPAGLLNTDAPNSIRFVAAGDYPAWSIWGVRRVALVPAAAVRTAPAASAATVSRAIVNVSVATLWAGPDALRPLDAPSAAQPVDIHAWLAAMTTADREWLVGRVQTQALYGMAVEVLGRRGSWSDVAVRGQPSQLDARGYPGWLPTRQLTSNLSLLGVERTHPVAVVTSAFARLRDPVTLAPRLQVTFATRLWITGTAGAYDLVATPGGGTLAVRASKVARYRSVAAIPKPTGARIVATARRFLGLAYLWGGTSAYGFDCSGLTYTVYRRFGIPLPRDADRQALHGTPVARADLRPGDLVFLAGAGGVGHIHHVAIYMGSGRVIEAPNTGDVVRIAPLSSLLGEYAGARRYL